MITVSYKIQKQKYEHLDLHYVLNWQQLVKVSTLILTNIVQWWRYYILLQCFPQR